MTTLWIPPNVYQQMMFYAQQMDAEIGGFGAIHFDSENDDIFLEEIFLPKQTVKAAKCDLVPSGSEDLFIELINKGEDDKVARINLSWHSHHTMQASFSAEDQATILAWPGKVFVAVVVNRKHEMKARIMTRTPVQISGDIDVKVNWNDVPEFAHWLEEMNEKVAVITEPTAVVVYADGKRTDAWTEYFDRKYHLANKSVHDMTDAELAELEAETDPQNDAMLWNEEALRRWQDIDDDWD